MIQISIKYLYQVLLKLRINNVFSVEFVNQGLVNSSFMAETSQILTNKCFHFGWIANVN
jgi:hypothetical protein